MDKMNKIEEIMKLWAKLEPTLSENKEEYNYLTEEDINVMHQIRFILKDLAK